MRFGESLAAATDFSRQPFCLDIHYDQQAARISDDEPTALGFMNQH